MKNFFSIMLFLGFVCVVAFTTEQQIFAENQSLKDTVYSNDESNQNITYVSSWDEFEKAITNSEVTYIRLTQDISYPSTRPENIVLTYRNNRLRSLVIDGNTHKIDLNKRARISLDGNGPIREGFDIEFKIKILI
ncbi:pectate lyase-like adhesive domain-containing protein [Holzapfeliella floricola]|uniref:pectate lyase-like adhesive domain-containing protein n=1 Tax=Holzapfeliella floricola TaxID=679249 RepID=UPI00078431D3|nr:pectate lyase-like adhesive domain-containing protein [Holzapfeliella floricola]